MFLSFFLINIIYITFTINTIHWNTTKEKKYTVTFPTMTCKESCVKSYKAQRKVNKYTALGYKLLVN